jgi:hypothetical protein
LGRNWDYGRCCHSNDRHRSFLRARVRRPPRSQKKNTDFGTPSAYWQGNVRGSGRFQMR